MADLKRLSKFLALMLRHEAEQFGLTLDSDGFTDTDPVWEQVQKKYPNTYTYDDLLKVVEGDETGKKRYEIQGSLIRALFGHSDVTPIVYPPAEPPELLYHGTSKAAVDSIRRQGLIAGARQYVHLTSNQRRASIIGERHSKEVVILTIRAADAHKTGVVFHYPEDEHWLVTTLPPEFIEFPLSI